jgi:hypothetical protein
MTTGNRTEHVADPVLARVQTALQQQTPTATTCPLMSGALLTGIALTSGTPKSIAHGLGRPYKGFLVTSITTATIVWIPSTSDTAKFIVLEVTANTTASVWVF